MRWCALVLVVFSFGCGDRSGPSTLADGGSDPCVELTALASGTTHPSTGFFELEHDGLTRTFKVRIPAGYDCGHEIPLVFANHGFLQNATMFGLNGSHMQAQADEGGFIAVFPNGVSNSWNGGSCCGAAVSENVDDVGFFRAMLDYVRDDLGLLVDRKRVYATGFSNGGFMSYRLACEASDVFAAIAPVGGSLVFPSELCAEKQTRPVPMLHIHGTADGIVAYDGAGDFNAVESVATWAQLAGCSADTEPASQPPSRLDTTCVTHLGCPEGVDVSLCSVDDGGHCWFGHSTCGTGVPGAEAIVGNNAEGIDAASAVWGFLSRFACEDCGL